MCRYGPCTALALLMPAASEPAPLARAIDLLRRLQKYQRVLPIHAAICVHVVHVAVAVPIDVDVHRVAMAKRLFPVVTSGTKTRVTNDGMDSSPIDVPCGESSRRTARQQGKDGYQS